jgi:hypothetical protein
MLHFVFIYSSNHHLRTVVLLVDVCGCVELLLLVVVLVLFLLLLILDCDELLLIDDCVLFPNGFMGVVGEPFVLEFVLLLLIVDDDAAADEAELANLNKLPTESSFLGGNLSFTLSRLFASSNDIFFLSTSVSLPKITLAVCLFYFNLYRLLFHLSRSCSSSSSSSSRLSNENN